jgi:hypothetical protein
MLLAADPWTQEVVLRFVCRFGTLLLIPILLALVNRLARRYLGHSLFRQHRTITDPIRLDPLPMIEHLVDRVIPDDPSHSRLDTLIDRLDSDKPDELSEVSCELLTELHSLTEAQAAEISPKRRAILHYTLRSSDDVLLVQAILHAAVLFGDGDTALAVSRLAAGHGRLGPHDSVRVVAESCLAALNARLEKERVAETLLRPAECSDPPNELLRPAVGAPQCDDNLLHPAAEAGNVTAQAASADRREENTLDRVEGRQQ